MSLNAAKSVYAIYDGRSFVPIQPVNLPRNQPVIFQYTLRENIEGAAAEKRSAVDLVTLLQNSPLNDPDITFERITANSLRGTDDGQFA